MNTLVTQSTIRRNLEKHAVRSAVKKGPSLFGIELPELIPGENAAIEASKAQAQALLDAEIKAAGELPKAAETAGEVLTDPQKAIGKAAAKAGEAAVGEVWKGLEHPLIRVGKVIAGAIILIFALWLLVRAVSPSAAGAATRLARP